MYLFKLFMHLFFLSCSFIFLSFLVVFLTNFLTAEALCPATEAVNMWYLAMEPVKVPYAAVEAEKALYI